MKGTRKKTSTPRKLGAINSPELNLRFLIILFVLLPFFKTSTSGLHILVHIDLNTILNNARHVLGSALSLKECFRFLGDNIHNL